MAVYIESRHNDGYMAYHAQDMIKVRIIHEPKDGYLLSYDKEVIKEELPLKDFLIRLRQSEGGQKESFEDEFRRINSALRQRREGEICDWLDHRYSKIIKEKRAVLMEHTHSVNMRHVELPGQFHRETETISSSGRNIIQSQPMTPDECFRVDDKEVYYLLT